MRRFYLRSLSKSSFDTIDQKARDSSRVFFVSMLHVAYFLRATEVPLRGRGVLH
jgi:hypothetical protein